MINQWIIEIGSGAIGALLNPLLFVAIIASVVAGIVRVKRERKDIRVRIQTRGVELKSLVGMGLLIGLVLSIVIVAIGIQVPLLWIYLVSVLMLMAIVTWQFRVLSAALLAPLAAGILFLLPMVPWDMPSWIPSESLDLAAIGVTSVIMGVLLLAEGLLMKWNAGKGTSPRFIRTPRGMKAGAFFTKRLWFVPLFLLVPTGNLGEMAGWWPVMTVGSTSWSLLLVPFVLGFQLTIVHDLPTPIIRQASQQVIWLSTLVTMLAVAGWWAPYMWLAAFAVAFGGRIYLIIKTRELCRHSGYHFINRNQGIMVVDIIPNTPAHKMGLSRGEIVQKVNGIKVKDESELYGALQKNRAHCKLEVLGQNGEIRFVQRALHDGQHHQLGIIMVEDRMRQYAPDSA
ncbi:PDZ domain-containing protein [Jeotgalibacillus marinus]|uniref:PDZ domain-containing protein n=1 Tax=Jeotgalibacillus marinus TaxID=86667 RepID=A0ABV3Q5D1_9BACL